MPDGREDTVVVVGNGMVGHRFCEKLIEFDQRRQFQIVTFCEESRAAYDRVGLTSFFTHRNAEKLMLANLNWYRDNDIRLHIGDRVNRIDRRRRLVFSDNGQEIPYRHVVLATGSYPFVPPVPGVKTRGVFVYRTIDDLENIIRYGQRVKRAAVIGGGLLGLEAAKAAYDLGLETHVVEFAPRLMPRQIDDAGSEILVRQIENLGVRVHLQKATQEIRGEGAVEQLVFADGEALNVDMVIVSAGIRPRDELARECELDVGERGGVRVDDQLRTNDPQIYAIGEVALHRDFVYGLVAPGYEMAEKAARHMCGEPAVFDGADLSTKLKLMGVDVASFGDYEANSDRAKPLVYNDPFGGVYKKLLFNHEGTKLLGGILVGDADDYAVLSSLVQGDDDLPCEPHDLMGVGGKREVVGAEAMSDDAQVCSCNNVSKGAICQAIRDDDLTTVADVKSCTNAGAGCGGCLPLVTDLLNAELQSLGREVDANLCEHFSHTRQELYEIVRIKRICSFDELLADCGTGSGCEICKPAIASILASLWNEQVHEPEHLTLQDTNDRFLANMQRGGLYSVVPRVPGGEITPDKLVTLGQVAKKYGLYTKITGGQRVDLFGAQVQQLPDIWEELVEAGFESGHAYGKALRTVKSCVGTTWCRYGVQDSVGFAVRLEQRYRGIRSPHKIKMAVSGCVRECAEAQCKDVGLVATESGYNLFVCGNGGAKPRHAQLLVADIDEEMAVRYIDRFLIYYISTADKLTRTAVWIDKIPGGLEHVRDVVVNDSLGIADELERQMEHLVDTYKCEWREVVENPERRQLFRQFVNTKETESDIEIVDQRGQRRPADWPHELMQIDTTAPEAGRETIASDAAASSTIDAESVPVAHLPSASSSRDNRAMWVRVGQVDDFPRDGGAAIKYGDVQIAVFNFAHRGQWYACQNMCPHKNAFVLSRGILGSEGETPKVACPLHKKLFSLNDGQCLGDSDLAVKIFPVQIRDNDVYLHLPPQHQLNAVLATELHRVGCQSKACSV